MVYGATNKEAISGGCVCALLGAFLGVFPAAGLMYIFPTYHIGDKVWGMDLYLWWEGGLAVCGYVAGLVVAGRLYGRKVRFFRYSRRP